MHPEPFALFKFIKKKNVFILFTLRFACSPFTRFFALSTSTLVLILIFAHFFFIPEKSLSSARSLVSLKFSLEMTSSFHSRPRNSGPRRLSPAFHSPSHPSPAGSPFDLSRRVPAVSLRRRLLNRDDISLRKAISFGIPLASFYFLKTCFSFVSRGSD